ncbi:MAG: hypothetical protein IE937_12720, partial [Gammaproteobacteria bacterium]|nr:hypothetical protein [Gammaproteobacteria bacterium]
QHNPFYEGEHADFVRLLHIATRSLRRHGFGDGPRETPEDFIYDALGLRPEAVDEVTVNLLERMDDLSELVQMLGHKL